MKSVLLLVLVVAMLLLFAIFGIDREVARRDFIARTDLGYEITGCIFQTNCDHYNEMLKELEDAE